MLPGGATAAGREAEGGCILQSRGTCRRSFAPAGARRAGPSARPGFGADPERGRARRSGQMGIRVLFATGHARRHTSPVAVARVCEFPGCSGCSQLRARPWVGATQSWPSRSSGPQRPHMSCIPGLRDCKLPLGWVKQRFLHVVMTRTRIVHAGLAAVTIYLSCPIPTQRQWIAVSALTSLDSESMLQG